jgi:hypothetical protein
LVGQDGTIQLVSWTGKASNFQDLCSHRVIVDGPLVSLYIQPRDDGRLRVVIGSLCGYVCCLTKEGTAWKGPEMVVQGLWNPRTVDEDSVLAVCALGDCIAVGTFSGRCMIYQACHYSPNYRLLWECTLPYSIHGLELRQTTSSSFDFLVLTRRSLHIFRPKSLFSLSIPPAKYSVDSAKAKLKRMLERPRPSTPPVPETMTLDDSDTGRSSPWLMDGLGGDVEETSAIVSLDPLAVESGTGLPVVNHTHDVTPSSTEPFETGPSEDGRETQHAVRIESVIVSPEGNMGVASDQVDDYWTMVDVATEDEDQLA